MTQDNRFKDKNLLLWHFYDEILVVCPKCLKRAVVNKKNNITLNCSNCGYHEKYINKRYIVEVKSYCSSCEKYFKFYDNTITTKFKQIKIACPHCNKVDKYEANYKENSSYQIKGGVEFYFNLEFWLRKDFRGNLFWAYNYKHLEYLKDYIYAKVRERNDRCYTTMVEILPKFIKSKKNRDGLIKIIDKLEKK